MIFTFYSFKGGVGRSMAMATVGYLLAQRGLKVLVVDFDLEAPGLERYFFDEPGALAEIRGNPGLIDFVLAYKRALTSEVEFQRAEFKNVSAFIVEAIPRTPNGGSVDLMSAGRRHPEDRYAAYALAVRAFDWQDFFHNWRGDRFFEWLRTELTSPTRGYDAVLVDSRTGVTEMGGVCAYQLADVAVLMCAPNYQNLDGTRAVVADFRSDAVVALRGGRPLEIVVLPSRVEQSDPVKRDRFFDDLERVFGTDGLPKILADAGLDYRRLAVPYRPELAIIERLVDETAAGSGALAAHSEARASYETLTDALTLVAAGERWAPLRKEAFARLTSGAAASPAGPIADVTKRSAGYEAFIEADARHRDLAKGLFDALKERQVEVWSQPWRGPLESDPIPAAVRLRALEYSRALIVCVGGSGPTSQPPGLPGYWTIVREAQRHRKPIIPVLLPGVEHEGEVLERYGLSSYRAVDLRGGISQTGIEAVVDALRRDRAVARSEAPAEHAPYPGAAALSEDDAPHFHGRGRELDELVSAFGEAQVVLLEGPAGVGKTSLVQAGLLPIIRRSEHERAALAPGETAWTVIAVDASRPDAIESIDGFDLAGHEPPVLCVVDGIDSFPQESGAEVRRVRVDAIERLIRRLGQRSFVMLVWRGSLADDERRDALERWRPSRASDVRRVALEPLGTEALRSIIEKPAAAVGHLFEPGLMDRLLSDAGTQPGAVAQIQLALADIWASRTRGWLTNKAYDAAGGIAGRFAQRLDRCLDEHRETRGDALAALLRNLVQLDARVSVVSTSREWGMLASIPAIASHDAIAVRDLLVQERLIDLWRDPQDRLLCALAQPMPGERLEGLVQAEADFVLWRQRFAAYVHQYTQSGRATTATLAQGALGEAEYWLSNKADQLSADERELIERSQLAAREREVAELDRQRQENERLTAERDRAERERQRAEVERGRAVTRARWLGVAAALLVAAVYGVVQVLTETRRQRDEIDEQRQEIALQASILGARRLAATDPTAGAVGLTNALANGGPAEMVLRAIYSLPNEPMARARLPHDQAVAHAAFLPDESGLVTAAGGSVRVWSLDGKLRGQSPAQETPVVAMTLSTDPTRIVVAWADGTLGFIDLDGRILEQHPAPATAASFGVFSADGQVLATTAEDGRARVRSVQGRELAELSPLATAGRAASAQAATAVAQAATRVALSSDGSRLVTVAADQTRLWDIATGRSLSIVADGERVVDASFDSTGTRIVTAGDDGIARVWNVSGRRTAQLGGVRDFPRHGATVRRAVFGPDGRYIATASDDETARLWDVDGNMLLELRGHTNPVRGVEFAPGFTFETAKEPSTPILLTISDDGTARVWNDAGRTIAELRGHAGPILAGRFDPTGTWVLTASSDGTARLWGLRRRLPRELDARGGPLLDVAVSAEGELAATAPSSGIARVWDLAKDQVSDLAPHTDWVVHTAFSPDGRKVVTASYDGTARITDLAGGPAVTLAGHDDWVQYAAFSPDGRRLVTASRDRTSRIWDLQGAMVERFEGHTDEVRSAVFSSDGRRVVTASADGTARLWSVETAPASTSSRTSAAPIPRAVVLEGHQGAVYLAVFSPDDTRILTAGADRTARLWNLSGELIATLDGHNDAVVDVAFSPDGSRLLTASSDGTLRLWDGSGKPLSGLDGQTARLSRAEFSGDGALIATAWDDGAARLWNRDGRFLVDLRGHAGGVTRAAFTATGDHLVTASSDGTARAWPLTARAFRARMSAIAMPCLNAAELQEYFLIEPAAALQQARACEVNGSQRGQP
jgi:WD40 repeat protein